MLSLAAKIKKFLKPNSKGYVSRQESTSLEFKETFHSNKLDEYLKIFAGFANNIGGYIIFGVTNSPRVLQGLSDESSKQFEEIDPQKISAMLLSTYSPEIQWESEIVRVYGVNLGVFHIKKCSTKPIVAVTNRGNAVQEGQIYYRYRGRTQSIKFAELHKIIQERIDAQQKALWDKISQIAKIGVENSAIIDTKEGLLQKGNQSLVIDESLLKDIKFIDEGHFTKRGKGTPTLKVVGSVKPVNQLIVKADILDQYDLRYTEMVEEVKKQCPSATCHKISNVIKTHKLKENRKYAAYCFRYQSQRNNYRKSGVVPLGVPSIYNMHAVNFIAKILNS